MSPTRLESPGESPDPSTKELGGSPAREPVADGAVAVLLPAQIGLYAAAVPRLLADERTRTIALALADGSRRPSELQRLRGMVRSTLFVRLGELTALGVVASNSNGGYPLRVAYQLNTIGRRFLANELLIERQERHKLARMGPGVEAGLGNILRLLAPISHPPTDDHGRCVLIEREPSGSTHTVRLLVEGHRIVVSDVASSLDPDVRFSATSQTWEDALVAGDTHGLRVAGDLDLGRSVMGAFGAALNG
jgi:DNA-binding HxlR family transcriptional regulator